MLIDLDYYKSIATSVAVGKDDNEIIGKKEGPYEYTMIDYDLFKPTNKSL